MSAPKYHNNNFEHRITKLEESREGLNLSLSRIEEKINSIDAKFSAQFSLMTTQLLHMERETNNRLWRNFYFMIGGFAGVIAVMAHGFHWY